MVAVLAHGKGQMPQDIGAQGGIGQVLQDIIQLFHPSLKRPSAASSKSPNIWRETGVPPLLAQTLPKLQADWQDFTQIAG
jgi:hypothetical protein